MPTKEQMEILRKLSKAKIRSVAIDSSKFDEATRTLTLSFASETPCTVWGDKEILIISEDAMDTSRFTQGVMPVLFNHNRDAVIASINRIWIENKKAYAEIVFDDDEESLKIMRKVQSGSCRGVSVGYKPKTYEIVDRDAVSAEGFVGPCYIARKWEVLEFSIVSVPADPTVAAGRSEEDTDNPIEIIETKKEETRDEKMTPEEKARLEAEEAERQEKEANARKEGMEVERKRCADITSLCAGLGIEDKKRDEFIQGGKSIDSVREAVLEIQKERYQPTKTAHADVTEAEEDKMRKAMIDGILLRAGVRIEKPAEGAMEFRNMSVRDMAIDILERQGDMKARRLDPDQLFQRALTTGALTSILDNSAKKSLSIGYTEAATTYKRFTSVGSLSDFKEAKRYRISAFGEPVKIPENGEFTFDKIKDDGVSVKLDTYGKGFTYTRQMFINDDLSVLSKVPTKMNAGFERMINRLAYAALAGITYSSGNKNLGTAGALSVTTLSEMRTLLRKQTDISGKAMLNLTPRFLIVPAAIETTAFQLINSTADPSSSNAGVVNPFRGSLEIIADATLDAIDDGTYYLVADTNQVDGIEVSYLNGNQSPIMESGTDPDTLGWRFRFYLDVNIKALDYRGFVKNAGV